MSGERHRIPNRLLVKVLRAQKLGNGVEVEQPYATVEIDEPAQKHTTTLGTTSSPYWDEHFLFDLGDRSEEILFEVYDKPTKSEQSKLAIYLEMY